MDERWIDGLQSQGRAEQKGAAQLNENYFYTKHTEVYINSKNNETKPPATTKNKLFFKSRTEDELYSPSQTTSDN
jgi:hypothetical protein